MTQRDGFGRLDSQEARRAFRSRYDECIFRAAYSLTGSYHQAQQLKRALFAQVEDDFCDRPLPGATELFLLSQLNLLYARGTWRQAPGVTPIGEISVTDATQEFQPADAPSGRGASLADAVAQPEGGMVTLGEVVYIPRGRAPGSAFVPPEATSEERPSAPVLRTQAAPEATSEEKPSAPVLRAQAAPKPRRAVRKRERTQESGQEIVRQEIVRQEESIAPAQPLSEQKEEARPVPAAAPQNRQESKADENAAKGAPASIYDPELTAEWSPNMDEEQPPLPKPEAPKEQEPAPQQEESRKTPEKRRSVPLTLFNCALALGLVAAGIYLVLSTGLL